MRQTIMRTGITATILTLTLTALAGAADAKPRKHKPPPAPALTLPQAESVAYANLYHSPPGTVGDQTNWTVESCIILNRKQAACVYEGARPYGAPRDYECWWGTGAWRCARPPQPVEHCRGWMTVELGWSGAGVVARSEPACAVEP